MQPMHAQSRLKPLEENHRKGAVRYHIREANRFLILNYIREEKTIPRADLAPYTDLSRTTVGVATVLDAVFYT